MEFIGNKKVFISGLDVNIEDDLPIKTSRCGYILGTEAFIKKFILKFDRRKVPHPTKMGRMDDGWFDPVEKVIQEFEKKFGLDIDRMSGHSLKEKRARGELLVRLKDLSGLTYREIKEFPIFNGVKLNSMAKLYRDAMARRANHTK